MARKQGILSIVCEWKHDGNCIPSFTLDIDLDIVEKSPKDRQLHRLIEEHLSTAYGDPLTWEGTGDHYEYTFEEYGKMWKDLINLRTFYPGNGRTYLFPLNVTFNLTDHPKKLSSLP
jgi:hypothetical protein